MTFTNDNDGYDAADNGAKCYTLAIRTRRLEKIRTGELMPRMDDAEELEAAGIGYEPAAMAARLGKIYNELSDLHRRCNEKTEELKQVALLMINQCDAR